MRRVVLVAFVALLLAGCSGGAAPKSNEQIVTSNLPDDPTVATSEDDPDPVTETPKKGTRGHIAGVVVDQAIRPIEGAVVQLPGMDLAEVTDRNGAFSFTDLYIGQYLTTANSTGFYSAETVVEVEPDEFTRIKFILTAIPPPTPYHFSQKHDGFVDMTDFGQVGGLTACAGCVYDFYTGGPGFRAILVEAIMDEYSGTSVGELGSNNFHLSLRLGTNGMTFFNEDLQNPARKDYRTAFPETEQMYRLTARPESFPGPEFNKEFQLFVTSWYYSDPPTEWSKLNGDE